MTIRVVIVDDQAMVRAGFAALLAAQADIDVVGEAPDGRQGIDVSRRVHPDVVLMDVRMPEMDGLAAARELLDPPPGVVRVPRVLMLTTFDVDDYVYEALRAGASGFLLKDAPPADLIAAVRVVAAGDALLAPSVTRRLIADFARQRPPAASRGGADAALREDPGRGRAGDHRGVGDGRLGHGQRPTGRDGPAARNDVLAGRPHAGPRTARPRTGHAGRSGALLRGVDRRTATGPGRTASARRGQPGRRPGGAALPGQRPRPEGRSRPPARTPRRGPAPPHPGFRPARPGPSGRGVRRLDDRPPGVGHRARLRHRRRDLRPYDRCVRHPGRHGQVAVRADGSGHRRDRLGRVHHPGGPRPRRRDRHPRRGRFHPAHPLNGRARGGRSARHHGVLPQLRLRRLRPGRARLHAADLVVLGSPGMRADHVRDLHTGARVWAAKDPGDWIGKVPHIEFAGLGHGADPASPDFGARRVPADDAEGHTGYFAPGTESLRAFAAIAQGV